MAEKKMTRVQALEIALGCVDNAEAHEVLERMRDQLTKPKAAATGKTKTRTENEAYATKLHALAPETPFDGKFVMEHLNGVLTPQKVVGIMRTGIEMGLFERIKDGKRTVYRAL